MKSGFIAKRGLVALNVVRKLIGIMAFAEEVTNPSGEGEGEETTPSSLNYEDLIAKARKDEKAKQYKTIEKLRTELRTMTQNNNNNLIRIGELESSVEELNTKLTSSNSGDSEAVKTLKSDLEKAQSDLATAKSELETTKGKVVDEVALRTQIESEIRAEYEVKNYRLELLSKNPDVLIPELVTGDTKEDLDSSLEQAKARSEEIRKQFGSTQQQTTESFSSRMPAISSPNISSASSTVTMEDLAKLNPASPEYAKIRKQLGLR